MTATNKRQNFGILFFCGTLFALFFIYVVITVNAPPKPERFAARVKRHLPSSRRCAEASGETSSDASAHQRQVCTKLEWTSDSAQIRERELCGVVCDREHPGGPAGVPDDQSPDLFALDQESKWTFITHGAI